MRLIAFLVALMQCHVVVAQETDAVDASVKQNVDQSASVGNPNVDINGENANRRTNEEGLDYVAYQMALDFAKSLWEVGTAGQGYRYTYKRTMFGIYPPPERLNIEVDPTGTISRVTDANVAPVQQEDVFVQTVPEIFDEIQDAIDQSAVTISVTYNGVLGYPEDVYIRIWADLADLEAFIFISTLCRVCTENGPIT